MERITTLEQLTDAKASKHMLVCPTIRDYAQPTKARDITALPCDIVIQMISAGLYIYTKTTDDNER